MHQSVLLNEAVNALALQNEGVYVDATFGRGGHSKAILQCLGPQCRLLALDRDERAVAAGQEIQDARFAMIHAPFSELTHVLRSHGVDKVQGVLLDLGVSSPQLDEAARGFSFRFDAFLDMRMDTSRGQTAAQWLAIASVQKITEVLRDYGEERFAYEIAKAVIAARAGEAITSTRQLAEIVAQTVRTREKGQHPATRTFQAIRIYVNQELEELSLVLPQCLDALSLGGRLVVISFHSLEDRIVKRFVRNEVHPPEPPAGLPIRAVELQKPRLKHIGKAVRASAAEIAANPRARSAIMRVAEAV